MFLFPMIFSLNGGGSDASTVSGLLDIAGDIFTWVFQNMATVITFITSNPIILFGFLVGIAGLVVNFFLRIWHAT